MAGWEHITPLLEEGLMPTLDAFIDRGVMSNLVAVKSIHRAGPMNGDSRRCTSALCKREAQHCRDTLPELKPRQSGPQLQNQS